MALSVGRMRCGGVRIPLPPLAPPYKGGERRGGYEYLYLPSPLLTKEGKGGAGIVNKLLNTYKDDRKGEGFLRGFGPARRGGRNACGVSPPHGEREVLRGFAPARRDPFVSAKGPKTIGARAWPFGFLCPSPDFLGCGTRFAQTVLAPQLISGLGRSLARRRLEVAPFDGAGYECLYLPSPLLTKEGKGGAGIVNKLLNTYKDDRKGEGGFAGFRPRTTRGRIAGCRPRTARSFCFGKRTQNHWRPGVALRVPLPRSRKVWAAELASLRQSSPPN